MKKLKYILFGILLCITFINNVKAAEELMHCEYARVYINSDKTKYFKYKVTYYDNNTVTHEYVPTDSTNYKKGSNTHNGVGVFDNDGKRVGEMRYLEDNFTTTEMQKYYNIKACPYIVFTSATGSLNKQQISPSESSDISKYSKDDYREVVASPNNGFYIKKENSAGNNNDNNITCVYSEPKSFPYKYTITCKKGSNCTINDPNHNISINSNIMIDIVEKCPDAIYSESANNTITSLKLTGSNDNKHPLKSSSEETTNPVTPNEPSTNNEYENDSRYIKAKEERDRYCAPADTSSGYVDDTLCYEAEKKMEEIKAEYSGISGGFDSEHFCKGPVQGVFTTLGWIFFVLKIIIPILLIIFGCIDVGKAIIASKDDEIKKSIKTLAVRAIAGIIIFFVPTILNLVVKLIDNSEVYNGTFWDCTKCMLKPTDDVCSTLRGNN